MPSSPTGLSKRQLKKIVKEQQSLLKKHPNNLVARLKLAGALRDLGRIEEALEQYHIVAEAYREAGRRVQALAVCRSILEFAPEDTVAKEIARALEPEEKPRRRITLHPEAKAGGLELTASAPASPPSPPSQEPRGETAPKEAPGGADGRAEVSPEPAGPLRQEGRGAVGGPAQPYMDGRRAQAEHPSPRAQAPGSPDRESGRAHSLGRIRLAKRPVVVSRARSSGQRPVAEPAPSGGGIEAPQAKKTPSRPIPAAVLRAAAGRGEQDETGHPSETESKDRPGAGKEPATDAESASPKGGARGEAPLRAKTLAYGEAVDQDAEPTRERTVRRSRPSSVTDFPTVTEPDHRPSVFGTGRPRRSTRPSLVELRSILEAPEVDEAVAGLSPQEEGIFAEMGRGAHERSEPDAAERPGAPESGGKGREEVRAQAESSLPHEAEQGADREILLREAALFKDLPEEVVSTIEERMGVQEVPEGHVVIREGEPGNALFVVLRGRFAVEKIRRDGSGTVRLGTLGPGDFFGEFALLTDRKRHATVRALEAGKVAEIARRVIGKLAKQHKSVARTLRAYYRRRLLDMLTATVPLFDHLPPEEQKRLLRKLRFKRYSPGDVIVPEGSRGSGFYLVLVGQVRVTKQTEAGEVELAVLGEGEYFGEMSLIRDQPAMATVRAIQPTELVQVAGEEFYRVVGEYPALWEEMVREVRRRELLNHSLLAGSSQKDPMLV